MGRMFCVRAKGQNESLTRPDVLGRDCCRYIVVAIGRDYVTLRQLRESSADGAPVRRLSALLRLLQHANRLPEPPCSRNDLAGI